MKIEDIIKYDDSFKELADILEKKEETELLNLSSFDTFVQDIFSLSYPQFSFRSWHIRKICLVPDTKIKTARGFRNISEIKPREFVFTHFGRLQRVSKVFKRFVEDTLIELTLDNRETIKITKEHPILTNFGWKKAEELTTNDIIIELKIKGILIKVCQYCGIEFVSGRKKYCSYGCSNKARLKGKTYEELYGIDKANEEKIKRKMFDRKNKTYEEIYGEKRAKEILDKRLESFLKSDFVLNHPWKNKTWEEMYGVEGAKCQREKIVKANSKEKVDWKCKFCGKEDKLVPSYAKNKQFCSYSCASKYKAITYDRKLEKNPNWIDGRSFLPYSKEFNKNIKQTIRERDFFTCQVCGMTEEKSLSLIKKKLNVHHIDHDKKNSRNENLITLCTKCNSKVNFNQDFWTEVLSLKILEKYNILSNGRKIVKKKEIPYKGYVYNLEVFKDNTYVGKGIIFHNCSFIDDVLNSENKMAVMALPRYHLKSTISGHALILYRFLKSYGDAFYCSYKDELAGIHLSNMKREVEANPILSKIMTDLKSRSESGTHYKIGNKKVRLYSAGVFSVKRGIHVDSACLLPGQKILTSGRPGKNYIGGYKNIEDIKIGTSVLSHKNRYRKVTNVFCRDINEDIVKLILNNREVIYVTKEHPILTTEGWKKAGILSQKDILFKVKRYNHPTKGKKYEEIHGVEKAIELKKDKFRNVRLGEQYKPTKGLTWEEYYGEQRAKEIRNKSRIKNSLRLRKVPIKFERMCPYCNEIYYGGKGQIFCSRRCNARFYSKGVGFHFRAKVGNFRGENNPNWRGGIIDNEYSEDFNERLKIKIRIRDDYTCQICGNGGWIIHHINFNKRDSSEENLISLCKDCHWKTNMIQYKQYYINYLSAKILQKYEKIINGTRIWKIEKEKYSGKVYNLEVEEDNTYSGRGIIFHNCIADDLLGTVENPMTLGELEKAERMFNQEIINIPNKGCPLIVFGTTIDYSDLLFKLKDNSEFMNLWMPAIHPDTEHEVLWDDVFDKKTLEIKKRASGWKAFSTEFLLTPVSATEAFLTREEIDRVIDTNLKSLSIFRKFEKEGRNVVAGLDIGKRRNPSHLSVFVSDENDHLIQICQEFWDEMEYVQQVKNIGIAIENFGIDKMFIDATRGEMEERGLPRECILIKFTGRGGRNQQSYATDFAKYVENKQIRLIDDDRFISQIVCMRNDLKAPSSPWGHGDSFWSVALAVGAFQDFYAKGRKKGFSYLGNLTESFEEKKVDIMKDDNVCKICNKRAFETLEDGRIRCKNCGVLK